MNMKRYYYIAVYVGEEGCLFLTGKDNITRTAYWNKNEKPLALSKSVAEDTSLALNANGFDTFVVERVLNPITTQFLYKPAKSSTECKIKLRGDEDNGEMINMHFSCSDDLSEGCDNCIDYTIYVSGCEDDLIDGGQMDFNSKEKNYIDIKAAILDLLEFAGYIGYTENDYEIISEE